MKVLAILAGGFLWGIAIGLGLAAGPYRTTQDELTALKHEAIRRGFACYTNDIDGKSAFVWKGNHKD